MGRNSAGLFGFSGFFFSKTEPAVDASFLRFKYLYLSLSFFLAGASGSGRGPGRYLILCTLFRCLLMVLGAPLCPHSLHVIGSSFSSYLVIF